MFGFGVTVTTSTSAVVLDPFAKVCAWSNEIFWIMLDLFSPVPASAAPAFCTKNTSSVAGYLFHGQRPAVDVRILKLTRPQLRGRWGPFRWSR